MQGYELRISLLKFLFFSLPLLFVYQNCSPSFVSEQTNNSILGDGGDEDILKRASKCVPDAELNRTPIAPLNQIEYVNTILDNFGVEIQRSAYPIPAEAATTGFANDYELLNSKTKINRFNIESLIDLGIGTAEKIMAENAASVMVCQANNQDCIQRLLENLAYKTYRRPFTVEESQKYSALVQGEESLRDGVELVLGVLLSSTSFLMKDHGRSDSSSGPISELALASKLSYMIWQSAPDRELIDLARQESLKVNVEDQILRMLDDKRAERLITGFADQWLGYRQIDGMALRDDLYDVGATLGKSAIRETEEFLKFVFLKSNRFLELWDGEYTFLNDEMEKHYDLPTSGAGDNFRPYRLEDDSRKGILTHASILTANAGEGSKTHPVSRGLWIMSRVLCQETPTVDAELQAEINRQVANTDTTGLTPREIGRMHSENPRCASCHQIMDPLGFGLENYNPIGQWRVSYQHGTHKGTEVEPEGKIFGESFSGPKQLIENVADRYEVHRCMAKQFATYAIGRAPAAADYCGIEPAADKVISKGGSFADFLTQLVLSDEFLNNGEDKGNE